MCSNISGPSAKHRTCRTGFTTLCGCRSQSCTSWQRPTFTRSKSCAEGQKVETVAVPAVLSVFNWPRGSDRYRRVERFAERLFANWNQFLVAPRHPKWRDVNLGATVPGWTRHVIAEQMLERFYGPVGSGQEDMSRDFQAFLNRVGTGAPRSQADREALFRQFLQWREQQSGRRR